MFFNADPGNKELPVPDPKVSAIVELAFKQIDEELRANWSGVGRPMQDTDSAVSVLRNFACGTSTIVGDYDAAVHTRAVVLVGQPRHSRGETIVALRSSEPGDEYIERVLQVRDSAGRVRYDAVMPLDSTDIVRIDVTAPESVLGDLATQYLRGLVFMPDTLRSDPLWLI